MLNLAQRFESDGGMNHCNFLLPASYFKFFSQNISRLMLFSSKPNFRRAHQFSFSVNKIKEIKGSEPSLLVGFPASRPATLLFMKCFKLIVISDLFPFRRRQQNYSFSCTVAANTSGK